MGDSIIMFYSIGNSLNNTIEINYKVDCVIVYKIYSKQLKI